MNWCRIMHKWQERTWVPGGYMQMSPRAGVRSCRRCGKVEYYHYDSQGGWWSSHPPEMTAVEVKPYHAALGSLQQED